jgi:NTE family protein
VTTTGRALVLGGGGLTGVAWELGILTGLRSGGTDLTTADLIVGTSAGAYVGALVATGVDLADAGSWLGQLQLELPAVLDFGLLAEGFAMLSDESLRPDQARVRIGALARRAAVGDPAEHVANVTATLPRHDWPTRPRLAVTAVATATGVLTVWDAASGVPLAEAIAASCAVPGLFPPVNVADSGYFMDGGIRSITNADLAAGATAAVVIAPSDGAFRASPAEQLAALGLDRGCLITPDAAAREAIGTNMLDPGRRGPALAAGAAQGRALAAEVGSIWEERPDH